MVNFGPFEGLKAINFNNKGSGVHLFRGGNGQGKTSVQNSILWALYGKAYDRHKREIPPTSLLNFKAKEQDIFQIRVTLYINHENELWTIMREMRASKHTDNSYFKHQNLHVTRSGVPLANDQNEIERILPGEVSRFFFFDGEMLKEYEELLYKNSASIELLKKSIEKILGVPNFRIARDDLDAIVKKLESERSRILKRLGNKNYEDIVHDFQAVSELIEISENNIKDLNIKLEELKDETKNKNNELKELEGIRDLSLKREGYQKEKENYMIRQKNNQEKEQKLVKNLHKTVLLQLSEGLVETLKIKSNNAMKKYDEKMSAVRKKERLKLDRSKQICSCCNTPLDEKRIKEIDSELKDLEIIIKKLTQIPEPNLSYENYKTKLESIGSNATDINEFKAIEEERKNIDYNLARIESELNKISDDLGSSDDSIVRELELDIRENNREIGRLEESIRNEEKEIEINRSIKRDFESKMTSIDREEIKKLNEQIGFVYEIKEIFEQSVSTYLEQMRKEVESTATNIFEELRSKKDFDRLSINEQFGLSIITKDGRELNRSEWHSAGESQVVALSLIGALNKCANIEAPIFMDTPFGRLDNIHGENILRYLSKMAEQVVLLATDREFRQDDEKYIGDGIKTDYTIYNKGLIEGSFIVPTRNEVIE